MCGIHIGAIQLGIVYIATSKQRHFKSLTRRSREYQNLSQGGRPLFPALFFFYLTELIGGRVDIRCSRWAVGLRWHPFLNYATIMKCVFVLELDCCIEMKQRYTPLPSSECAFVEGNLSKCSPLMEHWSSFMGDPGPAVNRQTTTAFEGRHVL